MPAATIRRAASEDQEAVLNLWLTLLRGQAELEERFGMAEDAAERWRNDFPEWIRDETHRLFVAERASKIVAFLSAERYAPRPVYAASSEVYVNELYVHPDVRRQGVGRQLVEATKTWAGEIGAERLRLGVLSANETGRAFWQNLGAQALSETLTIALEQGRERTFSEKKNPIGF